MIQIEPVIYSLDQGTATQMSVLILPHTTDAANCSTYYELKTDEGKVLQKGNYDLTDEQYTDNKLAQEQKPTNEQPFVEEAK